MLGLQLKSKDIIKSKSMRTLAILIGLLFITTVGVQASVNQYKVDEAAVEALFAGATEVPFTFFDESGSPATLPMTAPAVVSADKNPWVAFALAFVVGPLGIHRAYLGTKTLTWVGYILTCGGIFGIVPFVDWIVLLVGAIEEDISQYVDNPKFFMW